MEVLQGLIQDRVLWPLLPPGNVSARIETARARRAQLHVMLPDRSWSGIISKLFRMQATEKTLVSVLGSGYSDKTNSTLRGQRRSLAEKSHTWVGWTREEMDGIETRLHAMSDAADDIDPMDVLSRQTWLRGVEKKATNVVCGLSQGLAQEAHRHGARGAAAKEAGRKLPPVCQGGKTCDERHGGARAERGWCRGVGE